MDENFNIGYRQKLLAHLSNDLSHFKRLTNNHVVVQGRKTYESIVNQIGKPLPNRTNIVISGKRVSSEAVTSFNSIHDTIQHLKALDGLCRVTKDEELEVFIIGGNSIYKEFLPYADTLYITLIHHTFKKADTKFPQFSEIDWYKESTQWNDKDDNNPYDHTFITFKRKE